MLVLLAGGRKRDRSYEREIGRGIGGGSGTPSRTAYQKRCSFDSEGGGNTAENYFFEGRYSLLTVFSRDRKEIIEPRGFEYLADRSIEIEKHQLDVFIHCVVEELHQGADRRRVDIEEVRAIHAYHGRPLLHLLLPDSFDLLDIFNIELPGNVDNHDILGVVFYFYLYHGTVVLS
jgi:hypothetical protein